MLAANTYTGGCTFRKKLVQEADAVCPEVLHSLLRLQKQRPMLSVAQWIRDLEFILRALEAGRPVAETDWVDNGILIQ